MRVAVYAVARKGQWGIWISLDLQVDCLWWSGLGGEGFNRAAADQLVLLASSLPLRWAVKLCSHAKSVNGMQEWTEEQWAAYMEYWLRTEMNAEHEAGLGWKKGKQETWRGWGWKKGKQETGRGWGWEKGKQVAGRGRGWKKGKQETGAESRWKNGKQVAGWEWGWKNGKPDFPARSLPEPDERSRLVAQCERLVELLSGRSLLQPEVEAMLDEKEPELAGHWLAAAQLAYLQGRLKLEAAVSEAEAPEGRLLRALRLPRRGAAARRAPMRCLRCGSAALPAVRCTAGISPTVASRRWGLSSAQAGAAGAALGFLAEPRQRSAAQGPERFLLWAVTGAGKTEITFPLLEAVLAAGGRVLVATPRRDVVLELGPRLARAFPDETLAVLYGGSSDRWVRSQIVLATTHQLLRFHQSFDLVIIDELDAFPYVNDPMLAFAAGQACKPDGRFIYLSATPPPELQRQARHGKLPHARVPVRFHGHPLPVPQHLSMAPVQLCLKRGDLPGKLQQSLYRSFAREAQIFVFVSRIAHIAGMLSLLRRCFPDKAIEGTSSQDPARAEKVTAFRQREISLLVTTTILERGVTVPRSDVFILDADSGLFDEASLVQMAGRAGRSKDDPLGSVFFLSPQWTRSQRGAISQIRTMNTIARRQGLISKEKSL